MRSFNTFTDTLAHDCQPDELSFNDTSDTEPVASDPVAGEEGRLRVARQTQSAAAAARISAQLKQNELAHGVAAEESDASLCYVRRVASLV